MLSVSLINLLLFAFAFIFLGIGWYHFVRKILVSKILHFESLIETLEAKKKQHYRKFGLTLHQLRSLKFKSQQALEFKVTCLIQEESAARQKRQQGRDR